MKFTCPTCQAQLQIANSVAPNQVVQCSKCGGKIRLATPSSAGDDSSNRREPVHIKKKKASKSRRNESVFGFAVKAILGILGLAVLIVAGFFAYERYFPAPAYPKEFTNKLHGLYGGLKSPLQQLSRKWGKETEQGTDHWKELEGTRARVNIVKNAMRQVEPPSDGRVWHAALSKMVERADALLTELERLKTQPKDEATAKGRQLLDQFDKELPQLDAEVLAAKQQYMAAHNLQ
jgi:hypothetical protein